MVGLFLIALGTGGIKPCVSAFGGDQFEAEHVRFLLFPKICSVCLLCGDVCVLRSCCTQTGASLLGKDAGRCEVGWFACNLDASGMEVAAEQDWYWEEQVIIASNHLNGNRVSQELENPVS